MDRQTDRYKHIKKKSQKNTEEEKGGIDRDRWREKIRLREKNDRWIQRERQKKNKVERQDIVK